MFAERFERDYGSTEAEWRRGLAGAAGARPLRWLEPAAAEVGIGDGLLRLAWRPLPPRRIALVSVPRLAVTFHFEGVDDAARTAFMRGFDLHLHRGGG